MRARPSFYLRRLTPEVEADLEAGRVTRISPEARCPVCQVEAREHPAIERHEAIRYLCDGALVKL